MPFFQRLNEQGVLRQERRKIDDTGLS